MAQPGLGPGLRRACAPLPARSLRPAWQWPVRLGGEGDLGRRHDRRHGVVADAAGLERFALLGISQGCAFSIRYAVENPERVTCLVLLGGYLRGRLKRPDPEQRKLFEALGSMIRDGWGSTNPVFRHFFTSNFIPDATPEVATSFDELQRIATSPENALRLWQMNAHIDAIELAKQVSVPTLVLHCKGDRVAPAGRRPSHR